MFRINGVFHSVSFCSETLAVACAASPDHDVVSITNEVDGRVIKINPVWHDLRAHDEQGTLLESALYKELRRQVETTNFPF